MNTATVRSMIRCGYAVCSKDLFAHPSTSRILYNCTSDRNYNWHSPWPMRQNQRTTSQQPSIGLKQWSINRGIITLDHHHLYRYLSTSLPHNGQTALKPKSPDYKGDGDKKAKKEITKSSAADKDNSKTKENELETETAANQADDVPPVEEKLTLTAKFKKMYKEYWYVLLPVHVFTSCFWFTGFYYLSTRYGNRSNSNRFIFNYHIHFNSDIILMLWFSFWQISVV